MLKLQGRIAGASAPDGARRRLYRLSDNPRLPRVLRADRAYLVRQGPAPEGFAHYCVFAPDVHARACVPSGASYTLLPEAMNYLGDGDIVRLAWAEGQARVLFRASSPHNSFLVTERCNHYCLMCSQPPKRRADDWIVEELSEVIRLVPKDTREVGFTGGEPTLLGERFLNLLRLCRSYLPRTSVHVLSNGRTFADLQFAARYADVQHPDLMVGIPLYADDPAVHDYVVQARGAFDETVRGILNLKQLGQKVEVRVVLHAQTVPHLRSLAEFIGRNLLFVDHVALMGLEMTGFTLANRRQLWIDPYNYRDELSDAVGVLRAYGLSVSVYNLPLCVVNADIEPVYRKSISDWKNEYLPVCNGCERRLECGGFFSSVVHQKAYSAHLRPF